MGFRIATQSGTVSLILALATGFLISTAWHTVKDSPTPQPPAAGTAAAAGTEAPGGRLEYYYVDRFGLTWQQASYLHQVIQRDYPLQKPEETTFAQVLELHARQHVRLSAAGNGAPVGSEGLPQIFPLALEASTLEIHLPEFQRYRYEIRNIGDRTVAGPFLWSGILWNSIDNLVRTGNFRSIQDELERGKEIWRFVQDNSYAFWPVTEGSEEHNVVQFFSAYGYGLCDDMARVLATLARESGLQGRMWGLSGHVVPEVFANGKWRLLDPHHGVFFHSEGDPDDVYGVEELSGDAARFAHASTAGGAESKYRHSQLYLSTDDNWLYPETSLARTGSEIRYHLRPGEKVSFASFGSGKFFLGKYPVGAPPELYGGYFEYPIETAGLELPACIRASANDGRNVWTSSGEGPCMVTIASGESPFPLVGGTLTGRLELVSGDAQILFEDLTNGARSQYPLSAPRADGEISLDSAFAIISSIPTYKYSVALQLAPSSTVESRDLSLRTDFQFARLALLELEEGANQFRVRMPLSAHANQFEARIVLDPRD